MFLSGLLPKRIQKTPARGVIPGDKPKEGKRMTIIEAPARNTDLPVKFPQKDYHPTHPKPDSVEVPGKNLFVLVGDDMIFAQPATEAPVPIFDLNV